MNYWTSVIRFEVVWYPANYIVPAQFYGELILPMMNRREQPKMILIAYPNTSSGELVILINKMGRFKYLLVE